MEPRTQEAYAGAAITPRLIDREQVLEQAREAIAGSGNPVFYMTGRGGIGKTTLLREILRRAGQAQAAEPDETDNPLFVAEEVVDLYHPQTHTVDGLCRAVRRVFRPGMGYFDDYERQRDRYVGMLHDQSLGSDVEDQRERMAEAFLEDIRRLTDDYRMILAFDTAELLLYESDPIQRLLAIGRPGIEVREWLLDSLLPALDNAVVFIAGRPEPPQLRDDLKGALEDRLVEVELGPLAKEDSLQYFQAVAERARKWGAEWVAERIENIPVEIQKAIHHYAGGRPILLSLVIDYVVKAKRILPALVQPLEKVEKLKGQALEEAQARLEGEIVRAIQETGRPEDDTVRTLAWARRGLDAAMFAILSDVDEAEAARRLKAIEGLSFVKVRPADKRVFLQDEMYDLLQRHVLEALPATRGKKIYSRLVAYYGEEIDRLRVRMHKLTTRSTPDWVALSDVRIALQNAITEKIHYELRRDPLEGFEAYYRAAEEAFQSRHLSMDMQLREELLTFLRQVSLPQETRIADWATWDAGVRWVKRHIMREDYDQAIDTAGRLRDASGDLDLLKAALGPLAEVELDIWEATALTYAGEGLSRAQALFESAVAAINGFEAATGFEAWKCTYLLAHANNNLGYLLRTRGAYQETVNRYVAALTHWRRLKDEFKADHANTLNNLAFALAQMGNFNQALRYCRDALEMREEIGPRYPIALSLNTLAEIQIQNDQPHRAQWMAERALEQFQQVTQARGVGMAYRALAEALRRQAEIPLMYSPDEQIERLKEAESFADEASAIFAHEAREQSRLVGTLIELGCIYRNWARILPQIEEESEEPSEETSEEIQQPEDLADRATRTLERAIRETGAEFAHLRMDAFVNLAWHHYYLKDPDQARLVLEQRAFPLAEDYLIARKKGVPPVTDPITFYWVLLGKAHFLLGEMEMDAFDQLDCMRPACWEEEAEQRLAAAGEYYTLAVAYDQLFGYDFREMRRGLDLIYYRLKKLNEEELGVVYNAAHETARDCKLKKPPRFARFLEETFGLRTPQTEVS